MEIEYTILIAKFLKFSIVGLSGLVIDFGITYLCKEKVKLNKYISNIFGFAVAVCSNFLLNKLWTFEDASDTYFLQFSLFLSIALVGLLINQTILYIVHEYLKLRFYLAKLIAIGIVTLWNFGFNHFYTFQ